MTEVNNTSGRRSGKTSAGDPGRLVGAVFGQYRITGLLGAGGMGEVWSAEDTRLGRLVALKMLPEELAQDPERMARFTREAKVLASLNHRNIAVLYGLETLAQSSEETGTDAGDTARRPVHVLVMELVEGEGLDEIIAQGPMPFQEAVAVALQICSGLAAAHDRGIVHRDLKPANIRVRPDGTVKVLDFGLATTLVQEVHDDSQSQSPTLTQHRTTVGSVLGTFAYMSPEQARGKQVDRRADIWAFGCLMYEMLTSRQAFRGETLSDTMAAVLKDEPDWDGLPDGLEPVARHVLRRCLAKDRTRRFHDIADVRIELEEAVASATPSAARRRRWHPRRSWLPVAAGVAGVAAVAAGLALVFAMRAPSPALPTYRALTFRAGRVASARFAPDGRTVVYGASTRDRTLALLSTRTDSVESRPLELPAADILGISRDGRMAVLLDRHHEGSWVSVGTLAGAELAGGAPRPILERVNDGDISADGERMAVSREAGQTQRLEYPVGNALFETSGWISHPRISPDGRRVAFLHHPHYGDDRGLVAIVEADGTLTELTEETPDSLQGLAWSPDGEAVWFSALVFGEGGAVWSIRPGHPPVERLRSPISVRLQDIAPDGRLLLVAGDTRTEIAGLLAGHTAERRYEGWNDDYVGGIDAAGTMIAGNLFAATVDGEYACFVRRADGSAPVRLGLGDVFGMSPNAWWVFTRKLTRERDKLFMLPTGAGEPRVIDLHGVRPDASARSSLSCSLDGRRAAFAGVSGGAPPRIYVLDLPDDRLHPVGPAGIKSPVISPDGVRVAAVAPDGTVKVYPVAGGPPQQVAGATAREAPVQWDRDGRSLLLWNRSFPARIQRVGLDDGSRELALEIMPENPAGVLYGQIHLTPGGDRYVYRYRRDMSTLFLVEKVH